MGYRRSRGWKFYASLFFEAGFLALTPRYVSPPIFTESSVLQTVADGIEDDGFRYYVVSVIDRKLRGKGNGLVDGTLLDDFTQILCFGRGKFAQAHFVEDD
jgi:hypothetical protein